MGRYWAVLVFVVAAGAVAVNHPYENEPPIRSDGLGYHAWTRVLLDGSLSFCEYPVLRDVGAMRRDHSTGRCPNKYPAGLALLRFPVMGPITALDGGELRSPAADRANEILSVLAGTLAGRGSGVHGSHARRPNVARQHGGNRSRVRDWALPLLDVRQLVHTRVLGCTGRRAARVRCQQAARHAG